MLFSFQEKIIHDNLFQTEKPNYEVKRELGNIPGEAAAFSDMKPPY